MKIYELQDLHTQAEELRAIRREIARAIKLAKDEHPELLEDLVARYITITEEIEAIAPTSDGTRPKVLLAIDDNSGVRIADITKKAIEVLDNPNGFFMMVEGGKIDWMCHANDAATVLREVVDFDKAVAVAYEFARKHPAETLVVVTGDHETGGLTLGFAGTGYNSYINLLDNQKCSREKFAETIEKMRKQNEKLSLDDIKPLITEKLGLKFSGDAKKDRLVLTADEFKTLENSFAETVAKSGKNAGKFGRIATNILDNKSAVAWTSGAHTALPVSTTSFGSQSEKINGTIDNTDIAKMLKQAVR